MRLPRPVRPARFVALVEVTLNLPEVFSVLMSVSAQLLGLVSTSVCGNFPLAPP